jgi:hypothetical protein
MKKHSVRSRTRLLAAGTAFVSLIAAGICNPDFIHRLCIRREMQLSSLV